MPSKKATNGAGTPEDPWRLKTPPLTSDFTMHRDNKDGKDVLVCTVGKTVLLYDARCLDDLHKMLKKHSDWMELGSADEQKDAKDGTVEAWARSSGNPIGGWYGLKKGLRGRFGMYVPPLMEALGLAEVEHNARGNRMRAI
jgi:hypothetical protein